MIDVYCATASHQVENLLMSGCGILIIYTDEISQKYRLLGFGLGASAETFARIQTVRLALAAINPVCRREKTIIHIPDDQLLAQLTQPTEELSKLLQWHDLFHDIGFLVGGSNYINICLKIAHQVCYSQIPIDSLTRDGLPC